MSGSYLTVGGHAGNYLGIRQIGDLSFTTPYTAYSLTGLEERVKWWAAEVRQFVDTPDLWALLQSEQAILTGSRYEAVENTPFTSDERIAIATELRDIKQYVKVTYSLTMEQTQHFDQRFDHLEAASHRVGRKDWQVMVGGAILAVALDQVVPREALPHLLAMAAHTIEHLFGDGGTPPLPLPPR